MSNELTTTTNAGEITSEIYQPQVFDALMRVAEMMSKSGAAVPQWMRDNPGGCLKVCIDAYQWHFNPFGLAADCFSVDGGIVAYGAKATNAIVSRMFGEEFEHEDIGDWDKILGKVEKKISQKTGRAYFAPGWNPADEAGLAVKVWLPSSPHKSTTLKMSQCTVRNSTNWASNPALQLYYQAIKVYARTYKPGAVLGLYSVDEIQEYNDATDEAAPEASKQAAAPTQSAIKRLSNKLTGAAPIDAETQKEAEKINVVAGEGITVKADQSVMLSDAGELAELISRTISETGAPIAVQDVADYLVETGRLAKGHALSGKELSEQFRKWIFADGNAAKLVNEVAEKVAF